MFQIAIFRRFHIIEFSAFMVRSQNDLTGMTLRRMRRSQGCSI